MDSRSLVKIYKLLNSVLKLPQSVQGTDISPDTIFYFVYCTIALLKDAKIMLFIDIKE